MQYILSKVQKVKFSGNVLPSLGLPCMGCQSLVIHKPWPSLQYSLVESGRLLPLQMQWLGPRRLTNSWKTLPKLFFLILQNHCKFSGLCLERETQVMTFFSNQWLLKALRTQVLWQAAEDLEFGSEVNIVDIWHSLAITTQSLALYGILTFSVSSVLVLWRCLCASEGYINSCFVFACLVSFCSFRRYCC